MAIWSNWAGNQRCAAQILRPTSEPELVRIVLDAIATGSTVKAVGAGHSFSDIALSPHTLVDLGDYGRVLDVDHIGSTVTVQAGCRLNVLSRWLATRGLALENLGDIDVQTVAGATATATHGTGKRFGNLSSMVVAIRVVAGTGEVIEVSADREPELFSACRVGIGAIGLVSTITLRVVPAFHLHAVEEARRVDEVSESFDTILDSTDHFEFFWVPHTGWALTKSNRRNHEPLDPRSPWQELRQDTLASNVAFGAVNRLAALRPSLTPRLGRLIPSTGRAEYNDVSYRVFATRRLVHFLEMEYAIPLECTIEALGRVRRLVDDLGDPVSFPVEVRAVAADDIALSPAFGRPTGYIAVHMYRGVPYEAYFRGVESIMRDYDGRPHWGKLHFRTEADLEPVYPLWGQFQSVRERMDPNGVFANAAVRRVLG